MRLTLATTLVLQAVGSGHRFGFDIVDVTGYPTGTIYPALRRLEAAGLLRSHWESDQTAAREARPARRYYALTAAGEKALGAALEVLRRLDTTRLQPKRAR
jgi:PadR family transcriptional regulator, regulatory protein PadR